MPEQLLDESSLQAHRVADAFCIQYEDRRATMENSTANPAELCRQILDRAASEEIRRIALVEILRIEGTKCTVEEFVVTRNLFLDEFPEHADVVRQASQIADSHQRMRGERVGKYLVCQRLGEGAFGQVYSAESPDGSRVALKLLRVSEDIDGSVTEEFRREVGILQRLDHPGILKLRDFGFEQTTIGSVTYLQPYIVTELIDGGNLREELQKGPMSSGRAAVLGQHLLDALQYAHGLGICHLDLKPANILLKNDGTPVIADLGLAMNHELREFRQQVFCGSPGYMAPEQIQREWQWIDGRADLWAVATILFEAYTGKSPADDSVEFETHDTLRVDAQHQAFLSILRKARATNPSDRFVSAKEMSEALAPFAGDDVTTPQQLQHRHRWIATSAVVSLLAIFGVMQGYFSGDRQNNLPADQLPGTGTSVLEVKDESGILTDGSVCELHEGTPLLLSVRSAQSGWLYVISCESDRSVMLVPNVDDGEPVQWMTENQWRTLPEFIPILSKQVEHLVVIVSSAKLTHQDAQQHVQTLLSSQKEAPLYRGLRRSNTVRTSSVLIPYVVVSP